MAFSCPPGLPQREHLFDPFYSGRQAGRGRGLGLPTAWRLARAHGATLALVKGRAETSGPILLRAGFAEYDEERCYWLPLS